MRAATKWEQRTNESNEQKREKLYGGANGTYFFPNFLNSTVAQMGHNFLIFFIKNFKFKKKINFSIFLIFLFFNCFFKTFSKTFFNFFENFFHFFKNFFLTLKNFFQLFKNFFLNLQLSWNFFHTS